MKRSTILAIALAALAAALPASAAAAPADTATPAQGHVTAPLFDPAPIQQAKPLKCDPGDQEFGTTIQFVLSPEECTSSCTSYCQGEGGYLLAASFNGRGLFCTCTCCRDR